MKHATSMVTGVRFSIVSRAGDVLFESKPARTHLIEPLFAAEHVTTLPQANGFIDQLRLHHNTHEKHREIGSTPQAAWNLAQKENRSYDRLRAALGGLTSGASAPKLASAQTVALLSRPSACASNNHPAPVSHAASIPRAITPSCCTGQQKENSPSSSSIVLLQRSVLLCSHANCPALRATPHITVYTPGFVLDAREWHNTGVPTAAVEEPGVLRIAVTNENAATVSFKESKGGACAYEIHMARLGFALNINVKAGENSGRKLLQDFVVLGLTNEGMKSGMKELRLPAESSKQVANSRSAIAAWVTVANQIEPIQAVGGWLH